jgi:hypothetical protein
MPELAAANTGDAFSARRTVGVVYANRAPCERRRRRVSAGDRSDCLASLPFRSGLDGCIVSISTIPADIDDHSERR